MATDKVIDVEVMSVDNSGNIACDGSITADGGVKSESGPLILTSVSNISLQAGDLSNIIMEGPVLMQSATFDVEGIISDVSITGGSTSFVRMSGETQEVEVTVASFEEGQHLIVTCSNATNDCVLTLTGATFDGTNNTATFDAAAETLVLFAIASNRYVIVQNIGGVVLSAV